MTEINDQINQINKNIGQKIRDLRMQRGLTGVVLASKIGVSVQQLYKYESGINRIACARLIIVAKVLNRSLTYFDEKFNKHKLGDNKENH